MQQARGELKHHEEDVARRCYAKQPRMVLPTSRQRRTARKSYASIAAIVKHQWHPNLCAATHREDGLSDYHANLYNRKS